MFGSLSLAYSGWNIGREKKGRRMSKEGTRSLLCGPGAGLQLSWRKQGVLKPKGVRSGQKGFPEVLDLGPVQIECPGRTQGIDGQVINAMPS